MFSKKILKKSLILGILLIGIGATFGALTISRLQVNGDGIFLGQIISSKGTNGLAGQLLGLSADGKSMRYYTISPAMQVGHISISSDLTTVTLASPYISTNYEIFLQFSDNAILWTTNKTTNGFIISRGSPTNGIASYLTIKNP